MPPRYLTAGQGVLVPTPVNKLDFYKIKSDRCSHIILSRTDFFLDLVLFPVSYPVWDRSVDFEVSQVLYPDPRPMQPLRLRKHLLDADLATSDEFRVSRADECESGANEFL